MKRTSLWFKSQYDNGNGIIPILKAIEFAKEKGIKSITMVDDNFSGAMEFYSVAKKNDILPVFGLNIRVEGLDLYLIMLNDSAYRAVIKMTSTSISLSELNKVKNLNIVVHGFTKNLDNLNEVPNAFISVGKKTDKKEYIKSRILFEARGDRTVLTNVVPTLVNKHDYRTAVMLTAIKTGSDKKASKSLLAYDTIHQDDYYSLNDAISIDAVLDGAVDDYQFDQPQPPSFSFCKEVAIENGLPENTTDSELFEFLSHKGLESRMKLINVSETDSYRERLKFEIDIINTMGFPGYMLIVADFIKSARDMNIPVGPGRGSAAGSLVAFALGITNIDPIKHGLIFERFLNPERISMPDIDVDFSQGGRSKILEFVQKKYGKEKVAQIITFSKLGGKSALKEVGKKYGMSQDLANLASKMVPDTPGAGLKDIDEAVSDSFKNESFLNLRVWNGALDIDGQIRNYGVHAAGVCISDKPLYISAPVKMVNGVQCIEYEGKWTEFVDLIKFDFLGLKTLDVIESAMAMVRRNHGVDLDIDNLDFEDKKVLEMISTGNTAGIFQIESDGMQSLCRRLKPSSFGDLVAILALYRPGPMEAGMLDDFVSRKNGEKEVSYFFDEMETILKPILKETYGVIVYQEQVMQIVQAIGGFSLGESDVIRRAMGKKDVSYMNKMQKQFANGAKSKGLNHANAVELFELIIKFAGYGFNKSHSAAYGMITFQSAFLKTYYPAEFFASICNFADFDKTAKYIQDAPNFNILIDKPHVNKMTVDFDVRGENHVTYGFSNIKGVGSAALDFINTRNNFGEITSIEDVFNLYDKKISSKILKGLVHSGALDDFSSMRKPLIEDSDTEYEISEKLIFEVDFTGMFISDPLQKIENFLSPYRLPKFSEIDSDSSEHVVAYPAALLKRTAKKTKKDFSIISLFFNEELVEVLCFNKMHDTVQSLDITRPHIFEVEKKSDGAMFLQSVTSLCKTELEKKFFKKDI